MIRYQTIPGKLPKDPMPDCPKILSVEDIEKEDVHPANKRKELIVLSFSLGFLLGSLTTFALIKKSL